MADEADAVAVEELKRLLVVPALVAELDDLLEVPRQPREERVEARQVAVETWRELVQQRPQRVAELAGEQDEAVDLVRAIDQLLHMGDEAVDLDRVAEARRRLLAPAIEGRFQRNAVEAGVDLDRVELFGVALEPQSLGQAIRIEDPAPVFVDPARAADVDAAGRPFGNSCPLHRCNAEPSFTEESCVAYPVPEYSRLCR